METKHTPGPWRVTDIPAGNSLTVMVSGAAGYDLVDALGNDAPTNPADARLIAAAPDLLAALHAMLHGLRVPSSPEDHNAEREEACAMARAALAKAGAL